MTVTGLQVMSLEKWLADGKRSDFTRSDRHLKNLPCKISQVTSLEKWLADGRRSDVTWSDRHLKKVTSLLSSDEQMVEAKIACDATGFFI